MYFMFLPQGRLSAHHLFTLDCLASEDARLIIICACPPGHQVLAELQTRCDALYWKELNGYDFSAYAIGLTELAKHVPGADVLVLNDSMLGPFAPLVPFIEQAPWRLTGLTASSQDENHIQSFAFVVRNLDGDVMNAVSPALTTRWSYNTADAVILLQETRLARVANRRLSVGAFWYADGSRYHDLSLNCPELLLQSGFPLLKRSLFGKFAGNFQDPAAMRVLLKRLGHPDVQN